MVFKVISALLCNISDYSIESIQKFTKGIAAHSLNLENLLLTLGDVPYIEGDPFTTLDYFENLFRSKFPRLKCLILKYMISYAVLPRTYKRFCPFFFDYLCRNADNLQHLELCLRESKIYKDQLNAIKNVINANISTLKHLEIDLCDDDTIHSPLNIFSEDLCLESARDLIYLKSNVEIDSKNLNILASKLSKGLENLQYLELYFHFYYVKDGGFPRLVPELFEDVCKVIRATVENHNLKILKVKLSFLLDKIKDNYLDILRESLRLKIQDLDYLELLLESRSLISQNSARNLTYALKEMKTEGQIVIYNSSKKYDYYNWVIKKEDVDVDDKLRKFSYAKNADE